MAGAISHFISCETVPWTSSVTSLSYRAGKQLDRSSELGVWVQTSQSIVRLAAAGLKNRYNWMSSFQNIRKEQARDVAITASTSEQKIKRVDYACAENDMAQAQILHMALGSVFYSGHCTLWSGHHRIWCGSPVSSSQSCSCSQLPQTWSMP